MTMIVPEEQREENLKLSADAYVDLFHLQLRNGSNLYLKNGGDNVTWNGHEWEAIPLSFNGYEVKSDGQVSRPKLQVANPNGVFSKIVLDGDLDRSYLYRYRVLRRDIDNDRAVYQMLMWIIWYCTGINNNYIMFELRNPLDGNNFFIPARQFLPPEFPTVTFK